MENPYNDEDLTIILGSRNHKKYAVEGETSTSEVTPHVKNSEFTIIGIYSANDNSVKSLIAQTGKLLKLAPVGCALKVFDESHYTLLMGFDDKTGVNQNSIYLGSSIVSPNVMVDLLDIELINGVHSKTIGVSFSGKPLFG